jgi:hypothetical protein
MSEDLVNIFYEQQQTHQNDGSTSSSQSAAPTEDLFSVDSWLPALPSLTALTSSAMRMADDISSSLNAQAEAAGLQMQTELKKTRDQQKVRARVGPSSLPWETDDEHKSILVDELMRQVLRLPFNDRNFTEPPAGPVANLPFDFQSNVPVILRLLEIDLNLKATHARLAPKMEEEALWRNYFRRVAYLRAKCGVDADPTGVTQLSHLDAKVFVAEEALHSIVVVVSEQSSSSSSGATASRRTVDSTLTSNSSQPVGLAATDESPSTLPPKGAVTPRQPAATSGGRLLQELDDLMSPNAVLQYSLRDDYVSEVVTPPRGLGDNDVDDEINLDDLDLDDLDGYDLDLDEAALEAEIERELLEDCD